VGIDGLVLYDIDDESDRNPEERPFPFLPTMDPADYLARDLVGLEVPAIVYRAVSKYRSNVFARGSSEQTPTHGLSVFVGASSREKAVAPLWRAPTNSGPRCARISCSEVSRSQSGMCAAAGSTSVC